MYSQSETNVLKKFKRYIQCNPTLLALLMIKIKDNYSKPLSSLDLAAVRRCMNKEALSEVEFKRKAERYLYQVVHEGISWIDVTQIKMHLWLCLSDKLIDLTVKNFNHPETVYVFSTLYPTLSTDAIGGLLGRTMSLFKNLIWKQIKDTLRTVLSSTQQKGEWLEELDHGEDGAYSLWGLALEPPKWPFSDINNNEEDGPMKRAGHTDAPASTNGSQPTSKQAG
ncbi:hypothetical protein L210DRAFT_3638709 [Boletus edulis BED1]|uniref:Uncharacterized protein n=1 Tax=Boletus edulis BED1 TaxID=1328754 RepID=A0AAD4GLU9_BOLED|nr:hypothetical protein L210DRAFT_3638709 [Boletus edulis BED1]